MATGVADCYYNVVDLPPGGSFRFRVACVNKAGQGPYSNFSQVVSLDSSGEKVPLPVSTESVNELNMFDDVLLYLMLQFALKTSIVFHFFISKI